MSFRKRSVRPNLSTSKRSRTAEASIKTIKTEDTLSNDQAIQTTKEHASSNQTADKTETSNKISNQNELVTQKETNKTLTLKEVKSKAVSFNNQEVQNAVLVNKNHECKQLENINNKKEIHSEKTEESKSDTPIKEDTVGKDDEQASKKTSRKLSKRLKVTPKIKERKIVECKVVKADDNIQNESSKKSASIESKTSNSVFNNVDESLNNKTSLQTENNISDADVLSKEKVESVCIEENNEISGEGVRMLNGKGKRENRKKVAEENEVLTTTNHNEENRKTLSEDSKLGKQIEDVDDNEPKHMDRTKEKTKNKAKSKLDEEDNKSKKKKDTKRKKEESTTNVDSVQPEKKQRLTNPSHSRCSEEQDISSMTMQDLIHYRPKSFTDVVLRSKSEALDDGAVHETASVLIPDIKKKDDEKMMMEDVEEEDCCAPQVMLDENGEIIVNEASLTIKKKIDDSAVRNSKVLYEDSLSFGSHLKRKNSRSKRWKLCETLRFYKALSQIGTDFTLMSQAFGKFTRNELKKKFKKEEKVNCDLVDRALSNRLPLNMEMFLKGEEELSDFLESESMGSPCVSEPANETTSESGGALGVNKLKDKNNETKYQDREKRIQLL